MLGRLKDADGEVITLMPDLKENLAKVDQSELELLKMVDGFIEQAEIDALFKRSCLTARDLLHELGDPLLLSGPAAGPGSGPRIELASRSCRRLRQATASS